MDESINRFFKTVSPLVLAYMGDAYYELLAREYVIGEGNCSAAELNGRIKHFITAKSQSKASEALEAVLSETERGFYRAGLNSKPKSIPKSATVMEYMRATALECLFGYLYFSRSDERARALFALCTAKEENNDD